MFSARKSPKAAFLVSRTGNSQDGAGRVNIILSISPQQALPRCFNQLVPLTVFCRNYVAINSLPPYRVHGQTQESGNIEQGT